MRLRNLKTQEETLIDYVSVFVVDYYNIHGKYPNNDEFEIETAEGWKDLTFHYITEPKLREGQE